MDQSELEDCKKAGKISQEVREYIKQITLPNTPLLELAKKIHSKIEELDGNLAFPVNLSIDDIAAHYHPNLDDKIKANGLLKIDFGIHVNGSIADSAITIDLTPNNKYKELIESTELALENALKLLSNNPTIHQIGLTIQKSIESKNFSPITNLSGHSIEKYKIHAGLTIPNYANNNDNTLPSGIYAIEPFATAGEGKIYNGAPGNIYEIINMKNPRSPTARKILDYVNKKFKTLPFSLREIEEKFGPMSKIAMKELESQLIIHSHSQLIEKSHKPVAQSEHTFIKTDDGEIIVTTRD